MKQEENLFGGKLDSMQLRLNIYRGRGERGRERGREKSEEQNGNEKLEKQNLNEATSDGIRVAINSREGNSGLDTVEEGEMNYPVECVKLGLWWNLELVQRTPARPY